MSQKIILTIGIPASGKDTWAREMCEDNPNTYKVVNRDTLRKDLFTDSGSIFDYKYTKKKEKGITSEQLKQAKEALDEGLSVIVSDTNLNESTRSVWVHFAWDNGIPIEYKTIETPLHICIKRNSKRAEFVPESILIRMETKMREFLGKYVHDKENPEGLPQCVIVDIDGTLADMKGIRKPFEWDKVGLDNTRKFVVDYYKYLCATFNGVIIVFSGRDEISREATEDWLRKKAHLPNFLYMREHGSNENDSIVKEELFNQHVKGKYHVSHIIDDRKQVVQMWQSMGFEVMDVGSYLADF